MPRWLGVTRASSRASVLALVAVLCCAACGPSAAAPVTPVPGTDVRLGADWPTYHGDKARSGHLPDRPDPADPVVAWQNPLDGAGYASPLVVGDNVDAAAGEG